MEFAPENGWLEYDCFLLGVNGLFLGAFAVSFRECSSYVYFLFMKPFFWVGTDHMPKDII